MVRRLAGALKARAGTVVDVAFWHNPDLQPPLELGPIMATLPTFDIARR